MNSLQIALILQMTNYDYERIGFVLTAIDRIDSTPVTEKVT